MKWKQLAALCLAACVTVTAAGSGGQQTLVHTVYAASAEEAASGSSTADAAGASDAASAAQEGLSGETEVESASDGAAPAVNGEGSGDPAAGTAVDSGSAAQDEAGAAEDPSVVTETESEAGSTGETVQDGGNAGETGEAPGTGDSGSGTGSGLPEETVTPTPTPEAGVDKSGLDATIADARTRDLSGFTPKSAALFTAAIAVAQEVSEDKNATEAQVKQAGQLLVKTYTSLMTKESTASAYDKAKSGQYDGIYTVSGKLLHATANNQLSMGNDALKKPFQIIVRSGQPTLRIEFVALTAKLGTIPFTGYLGKLNYFPGYTGSAVPSKVTPATCPVESYYDVVDEYNDAKTGLDATMKGKKYPHFITMPVQFSQNSYFVQVYVPVMEAISSGSGTQFAKLEMDWSTMKQTAGTSTNQTALKDVTNLLRTFLNALNGGKVKGSYTSVQKKLFTAAAEAGEAALSDMNITQAEVTATADALTHVTTMYSIKAAADKKKLAEAISQADGYLSQTSVYTPNSLNALKTARASGSSVYEDFLSTQKQVDDQTAKINAAIKALQKQASKSKLAKQIKKANKLLKKKSTYTKASLKVLKKAKNAANKVYKNKNATQKQVNSQVKKLKKAIKKLKKKSTKKTSSSKSKSSTSKSSGGTGTGSASAAGTGEKADFATLTDGTYSITGSMVKIDKSTASMSNDAVNHTMKLTVKGGAYYVTLEFKGLKINSMLGYLGKLRYYQTGYSLDGNGSPQGSLGDATVESYQTDSSGNKLKDSLGTDYPREVTVPLIPEALQDGFVPLQVFVPIMESISAGTGTQPVFLKLDKDSVRTGYSGSGGGSASAGQSSLPGSTASAAGSSGTASAAGSALAGSTLGDSGTLDPDDDDADEEETEGSVLGGLGTLSDDSGTEAGEDPAELSVSEEEDGVTEVDMESASESASAEADETPEPPLKKAAKPMGIGSPIVLAGIIANILRKRKWQLPWIGR